MIMQEPLNSAIILKAITRLGNACPSNTHYHPGGWFALKVGSVATSKFQNETKERLMALLKGFDVIENYRPDWLRNPKTGYPLEIDLYMPEAKVGIEVQGVQHYKFTPGFHKDESAFEYQKEKDRIKKEKCESNGVYLFEVFKVEDIENFIEVVHDRHPTLGWELYKKNAAIQSLGYLALKLMQCKRAHSKVGMQSYSKRILFICKKYNYPIESVKANHHLAKLQRMYPCKPLVRFDHRGHWEEGRYKERGALIRIENNIAVVKTKRSQELFQFDLNNDGMEICGNSTGWRIDMTTLPDGWHENGWNNNEYKDGEG